MVFCGGGGGEGRFQALMCIGGEVSSSCVLRGKENLEYHHLSSAPAS